MIRISKPVFEKPEHPTRDRSSPAACRRKKKRNGAIRHYYRYRLVLEKTTPWPIQDVVLSLASRLYVAPSQWTPIAAREVTVTNTLKIGVTPSYTISGIFRGLSCISERTIVVFQFRFPLGLLCLILTK